MSHAGDERHCRDPEARGCVDPVLLSDDANHRGRRRDRHPPGDLPPGAGRRAHGRRFRAGVERPAAGGLCDAVRAWGGKRLRRRRHRVFRLDPGDLSAIGPSARDRAALPDVQIEPQLCRDHQIGRGGAAAARNRQHHAPRLRPGEKRPLRSGHGRGAGRYCRRRGRNRSERPPAGPHHPIGRRCARHRRGGEDAARRRLSVDPRRAGRLLCRGDPRAAPACRIAASAGDDDLRRQERLSRRPRAGARGGWRHLYRARPPFPAQIRPGAGRRLQLHPARHRHPGLPVRQEIHPRDQRHPRPAQGLRRRSRDSGRRQARARPIDRGGARPARRKNPLEQCRAGSRGQTRGMARPLAIEAAIRTSTRSTPTA